MQIWVFLTAKLGVSSHRLALREPPCTPTGADATWGGDTLGNNEISILTRQREASSTR